MDRVPKLRVDVAQQHELDLQQNGPGFSPDFLRHYCETQDLEQVTYLEIQADSATQSLELLGQQLPQLRQLKLSSVSSVLSLRDLGSSLGHLEVLWMTRCGLQDLGGAPLLPSLREFYLSFNDVVDLTPLTGCEQLEVLDLEGNAVADAEDVRALGSLPRLRELNLSGNPVSSKDRLTREGILELLPSLEVLDDEPLGSHLCRHHDLGDDCHSLSSGSGRREESPQASLDEEDVTELAEPRHPLLVAGFADSSAKTGAGLFVGEPDETELVVEQLKRARRNAGGHAFTARPGFTMQPPDRRTRDDGRPATATSRLNFEELVATDAASELTCGESLAGNPMRALRRRHPSGAQTAREAAMDIRELLQRYQTYTQGAAPVVPIQEEDAPPRPATPDVRVRGSTPKSDGFEPRTATPKNSKNATPSSKSAFVDFGTSPPLRKGRPPLMTKSSGYARSCEPIELS
ncbi:unnamed protein product [Effrenium voratum]|nr:unnamed protein product [Effrenium voratum]